MKIKISGRKFVFLFAVLILAVTFIPLGICLFFNIRGPMTGIILPLTVGILCLLGLASSSDIWEIREENRRG